MRVSNNDIAGRLDGAGALSDRRLVLQAQRKTAPDPCSGRHSAAHQTRIEKRSRPGANVRRSSRPISIARSTASLDSMPRACRRSRWPRLDRMPREEHRSPISLNVSGGQDRQQAELRAWTAPTARQGGRRTLRRSRMSRDSRRACREPGAGGRSPPLRPRRSGHRQDQPGQGRPGPAPAGRRPRPGRTVCGERADQLGATSSSRPWARSP